MDVKFGMIQENGKFPVGVSGPETVAELIEILLTAEPKRFPWLDFGADIAPIVFENLNRDVLAKKIEERLSYAVARFLPFVQIVEVSAEDPVEDGGLAVNIKYVYNREESNVTVPVLYGSGT